MSSSKRILADFRELRKNPIDNCYVRMHEDDSTLWDVIIQWELDEKITAPLHLLIKFPPTYPQAPPNVGFSCDDIGYSNGATSVDGDRSSPLFGKLTICLDILGNFSQYHTEWATQKGSGWSPAYTATLLLINIMVVLSDCAVSLQAHRKKAIQQKCFSFMKGFCVEGMCPEISVSPTGNVAAAVGGHEEEVCTSPLAAKRSVSDHNGGKMEEVAKLMESLRANLSAQQQEDLNCLVSMLGSDSDSDEASSWSKTEHKVITSIISSFMADLSSKVQMHGPPSEGQLHSVVCQAVDRIGSSMAWYDAPHQYIRTTREALWSMGWDAGHRCPVASKEDSMSVEGVLSSLRMLSDSLDTIFDDWERSRGGEKKSDIESCVEWSPDPDIICWYSLNHYTEDVLGVGVNLTQNGMHVNLTTDGSMLSHESFEEGVRMTPMKDSFNHFLPLWITPIHSLDNPNSDWKTLMCRSVAQLGRALHMPDCRVNSYQESEAFARVVLRVYPDLINIMIVKMMQPTSELCVSERLFRVLMDFWRTLYWFFSDFPLVKLLLQRTLMDFTHSTAQRQKSVTPNIGWLLAMSTVMPVVDEQEGGYSRRAFVASYVQESMLRSVMWWKKSGCRDTGDAVFSATSVSRRLLMFQVLFMQCVIGADAAATSCLADSTECKLGKQLDTLLGQWKIMSQADEEMCKNRGVSPDRKWEQYFEMCDCPSLLGGASSDQWVQSLANEAATKTGYFFSNSGRGGRGRGRR